MVSHGLEEGESGAGESQIGVRDWFAVVKRERADCEAKLSITG